MTIQPVHLAGAVILDEKNRLLVMYRPEPRSRWETPGGKVEPGETAADAVVRELKEELAVTVAIKRPIGTTRFVEHTVEHSYEWFLATIITGTPTIQEPDKHAEIGYFDWYDLTKQSISFNLAAFLKEHPSPEAM